MRTILTLTIALATVCWPAAAQKLGVIPPPVSGRAATRAALLPADVLARALLLADELEAVRFEMGKPKNTQRPIGVEGAAPREVYFQALTAWRKSNRLCFELTRTQVDEPAHQAADKVRPADVWAMVNHALKRIYRVKRELGIETVAREQIRPKSITPTDVFRAIVQVNRQLNNLLLRPFAPADVFQQVTQAINIAARLLSRFPNVKRIPEAPKYEHGKRPANVYGRLMACQTMLGKTADASGLSMLTLTEEDERRTSHKPGDVYDLATLLVSELSYLHAKLGDTRAPPKSYYPGRKFPSHVYQRAGILMKQLTQLRDLGVKNPGWLRRAR